MWARFEKGRGEAVEKEEGEEDGVEEGEAVIGLDEPVVVDNAGEGGHVDEAVESLPVFSAETANPTSCRSNGQRNEQNEPGEADGDEGALGHVFHHGSKVEGLVGTNVGEEVEGDVEESEETEHATETDEVGKVEKLAEGSDGECDEEEPKGPIPGEVLEKCHGLGADIRR